MEKKHTAFLAVLWVFILGFAAISEAQTMDANQALSAQQQRYHPHRRLYRQRRYGKAEQQRCMQGLMRV